MGAYLSTSRGYSDVEKGPSSPALWQRFKGLFARTSPSASSSSAISGVVRFSNVVGEEALFTEPASPDPVERLKFALPGDHAASKSSITEQEMDEDDPKSERLRKQHSRFISTQQFIWEEAGGFESPLLGSVPVVASRKVAAKVASKAARPPEAAAAASESSLRAVRQSGPAAAALSAVSALSTLSARTGAALTSPPLRNISNSMSTPRSTAKAGKARSVDENYSPEMSCWGDVSTPTVKTPYVKTPTRIRFRELV